MLKKDRTDCRMHIEGIHVNFWGVPENFGVYHFKLASYEYQVDFNIHHPLVCNSTIVIIIEYCGPPTSVGVKYIFSPH